MHPESALSFPFSAALTHPLYFLLPLQHHRARYWNEQHFAALAKVESVAEKQIKASLVESIKRQLEAPPPPKSEDEAEVKDEEDAR